ncbi:hypothetical protein B0H13DRAFT_1889778 [Mycena leptocephala]|nr:hypothetical protein B0H13DRAFT_1889778 [Mycena leptocephala]
MTVEPHLECRTLRIYCQSLSPKNSACLSSSRTFRLKSAHCFASTLSCPFFYLSINARVAWEERTIPTFGSGDVGVGDCGRLCCAVGGNGVGRLIPVPNKSAHGFKRSAYPEVVVAAPSRMLKAGCSQSASSSLAAWQTAILAELSNGNRRDCNKLYVPQITMIEERTPELGLEPGIFYPRTKPHRDREEAMQKPQNMEAVSRCQLIENTEFEKGNLPGSEDE